MAHAGLALTKAKRTRGDADAGVRDCVELMTSGRWVTGKSHRTVAAKHGVAPATVKDWATSASRIIRASMAGDLEDVRARMLATLDTVVARAMRQKKAVNVRHGSDVDTEFMDAPDLHAAVSAISAQAALLGLVVQRHKVDADVTRSDVDDLTLARSVVAALESGKTN